MSEQQEKQTTEVTDQLVEATTAEVPTKEEDIFADIFGDNSNEFIAQQDSPQMQVQNEPSEQAPPADPKEDATQFQYWQSQADKRSAEVDLLKSQVTDLMSRESQPAPVQPVVKETESISRPVKPNKPADFDHSDALTDPDSSSAKYLAARDGYVEDMSDYMIAIEEQRGVELEQAKSVQRKAAQEAELLSDLQSNYDYSPSDAKDFVKKMTSPESLTLDNLVKLHRLDLNEGQQTISQISNVSMEKQATMSNRQQKLSMPKPVAVQPSVNMQSSKKTAENTMMDSMLGDYKKRNPFS
jgi:hypothetical protein